MKTNADIKRAAHSTEAPRMSTVFAAPARKRRAISPRTVAAQVAAVLHRQGRAGGVIFPEGMHATLATGGAAISVFVADAQAPNGQREFIISVREVDQ